MKVNLLKQILLGVSLLCVVSCGKVVEVTEINIVPEPVSVEQQEGVCVLTQPVKICLEGLTQNSLTMGYVTQELRKISLRPSIVEQASDATLVFALSDAQIAEIGEEGYQLSVTEKGVRIVANTETGLFYGYQTFVQLLPDDVSTEKYAKITIPQCEIVDYPRFAWRGSHMDVCRHWFGVEQVKKHLDIMAAYKMNRFHWHLTEDQGWRIEIEKYPLLTEVGAWRVDRTGEDWNYPRDPEPGEKATYGGFYTKDDVREIVSYAKERHIEVVPEIEFPGHCCAAMAAYPELSCDNDNYFVPPADYWDSVRHTGGKAIMCAGNPKTMRFLKDVMDEIVELFPFEYIHVGGDEANKLNWSTCPKCQHYIDSLGLRVKGDTLKSCNNLQSWLTAQIEQYLISKGKRIIGWDEILEGFVTESCTVMSWRGMEGGIAAARNGNDVIMTPTRYCYFDYRQGDSLYQPVAIGRARTVTTIKKVYQFDPMPSELTPEEQSHILGGQCNLWAEFIETNAHQQYLLLPRLCAMAECLWSQPNRKDWGRFQIKIEHHKDRIKAMGYNLCWGSFKPELEIDTIADGYNVTLVAEELGTEFHYTTDGSEPTMQSPVYTEPLKMPKNGVLKTLAGYRNEQREGVYEFKF
ncbi:MAG: family 20 glycosylhydrolase [Bacteroidales bacterium]|nr:family 20 glycosylhydrolase [Candidatus Colimorpha onthohippi]